MPSASYPEVELDGSPFSLARVIKRMKVQSAPSPFDRVGYVIFNPLPIIPAQFPHMLVTAGNMRVRMPGGVVNVKHQG